MLVGRAWRIVAMVLTSGLIVATRGWEAAKPCITKGHVYSQLQWYGYLLQKTFHTQTAKVQYQLSFPLRECCANLLIYYDDQVRDLKADMTCSERENLLPKSNNQVVPLGIGPESPGCTLRNTSDGPIVICVGERTFQSSDPRTWYFALSRCQSSTSLSMWYYFNITGFYGDCEADPLSKHFIPPKVESRSYLYLSIALGVVAGVAMMLAAAFFVLWCYGKRRDAGKNQQKPVPNNLNHHQTNQQQQQQQQQQNHHQFDNNHQQQQHSTLSQQQFQLQQHQTQLQLQHQQLQQHQQQQQQQQQQHEQFENDIQPQGACPLGASPLAGAVAVVSSQCDPPREIYFVNSTAPEQCVNTSDYSRSSSENDYEVIPDGSKSGGDTTDRKQLSVPRKGRHRLHNHSQGPHHHSHHHHHHPHALQNSVSSAAATTSVQSIPLQNIGLGTQVANCAIGSPFIPPLPNHRTFPSQGPHGGPNMAFGNNYVPQSEFDNYRMNLYNANVAAAAAAAGNKLIGIPNASVTPYHVHNLNLGMPNPNITVNPFSGLKLNQQQQQPISGLAGSYGLASNPDGINVTNFRPIDPPSPPRSPPRSQSFSPLQGAMSNSQIIPNNTSTSAMSIGRHASPNPRMGSTARMSRDYRSFHSADIPLLDDCMMPPPPPAPPYPMQSLGTQAMIPSPPSSRYNSDSTDPLTRSSETST